MHEVPTKSQKLVTYYNRFRGSRLSNDELMLGSPASFVNGRGTCQKQQALVAPIGGMEARYAVQYLVLIDLFGLSDLDYNNTLGIGDFGTLVQRIYRFCDQSAAINSC
jgi:hypothetical protein